jgi:hypothetical protein
MHSNDSAAASLQPPLQHFVISTTCYCLYCIVCTGKHWLYEATVGAGLPVLSTLKNLLDTGDRVVSIEGILSGTLSYLFNTYKPGDAFSGVVAQAKGLGYTEPDPRDDLSGGAEPTPVAAQNIRVMGITRRQQEGFVCIML